MIAIIILNKINTHWCYCCYCWWVVKWWKWDQCCFETNVAHNICKPSHVGGLLNPPSVESVMAEFWSSGARCGRFLKRSSVPHKPELTFWAISEINPKIEFEHGFGFPMLSRFQKPQICGVLDTFSLLFYILKVSVCIFFDHFFEKRWNLFANMSTKLSPQSFLSLFTCHHSTERPHLSQNPTYVTHIFQYHVLVTNLHPPWWEKWQVSSCVILRIKRRILLLLKTPQRAGTSRNRRVLIKRKGKKKREERESRCGGLVWDMIEKAQINNVMIYTTNNEPNNFPTALSKYKQEEGVSSFACLGVL